MEKNSPVIIAGAGPTGLSLALILRQHEVNVRVIEKRSTPFVGQRGGGLMPRTLELFEPLGILPEILKMAGPPQVTELYLPKGREPVKVFEFAPYIEPTPDRPYPNPKVLWQSKQEELLRRHLEVHGVTVEYNTEMRGFEEEGDQVTVILAKRDDIGAEVLETVHTPYLISAEGARSVVRKQLQLGFDGVTTDQCYVIGDIEVLEGLPRERWFFCGEATSKMISLCAAEDPESKYMYLLATGPDLDNQRVSSSKEELVKEFYELTGRTEVKFGNLLWISSYTPKVRTVKKFNEGRCFVAGDAAHIFALSGAQGLNAGFQDAVNLGWKLASVINGASPASLLDSYSVERLPVITQMLNKSREVHDKTFSSSIADEDSDAWDRGGDFDMLHLGYRKSPAVIDQVHSPDTNRRAFYKTGIPVWAGDRAPDASELHNIKDGRTLRLFQIFGTTFHTVLLFVKRAEAATPFLEALKGYKPGLVKSVIILDQEPPLEEGDAFKTADYVVIDKAGHGRGAWIEFNSDREVTVAIVRPDLYIGAFVGTEAGVKEYFGQIYV